jgi:methionyl-tRNA formyltransferase
MTPPPVKVCATELGIPVFQPETLRDGEAESNIRALKPDVIVTVAYGKILPEAILNIPEYGCVNGHASLLPRHRGASPIQWAIVSGDDKTGITTMYMAKGIDTGDMLLRCETEIGKNETAGELHDRLSVMGAALMVETLDKLLKNEIVPEKQDDALSTYAPIINKEMGFLTFDKNAEEINNLIRGFNRWPAAYFMLEGKRIKVFASKTGDKTDKPAATVISSDGELTVACADGTSLILTEIQPEGSKRMSAKDYLTGHPIKVGTVIGK